MHHDCAVRAGREALGGFEKRPDQTKPSALPLHQYAMKPSPAKPRIVIAQVEGSGTSDAKGEPTGRSLKPVLTIPPPVVSH
jgi:hypothetical protein